MGSNFQTKQKEAWVALLQDKVKYLLYGGAAGGGKSYFLRWAAFGLGCYMYERYGVPGLTIGLFCEDYPALKDRQITKIKKEFFPEMGRLVESRDEGYLFEARGGAFKIMLRNLDDPAKYASVEFAAIFVDELTKNPLETFEDLRFRLRYPGVPFPKFVGATNPGSVGHGWVKKLWITPDPNNPDKEQDLFKYIPSRVYDNQYIADSYITQLESLPEKKRKAFLEGSWDIFAGQVFNEWSDKHIVEPFTIPEHWPRYISFDPGYNAPFSVNWYTVNEDGRSFKYRELYMNGLGFEGKYGYPLTATRLAELILKICKDNNEDYVYCAAGPDLWNKDLSVTQTKDGSTEGESAAETMLRLGLKLVKAPSGPDYRANKLRRYHEMLADAPDGKPWYQVFRSCYDSIRTIPALVHDEHKVEDVDTNSEDHCLSGDTFIRTLTGRVKIKNLVGKSGFLYSRDKTIQKFSKVRSTGRGFLYVVEFEDGSKVKATGNHQFLTAYDVWLPLILLRSNDMIQTYLYDRECRGIIRKTAKVFGAGLLHLRSLFSKEWQTATSYSMDVSQRENSTRFSHTSHRWKSSQQSDSESSNNQGGRAFEDGVSKTGANCLCQVAHGEQVKAVSNKMAWFRGGEKVAQCTCQENSQNKTNVHDYMHYLWEGVSNLLFEWPIKILSNLLWRESEEVAKIKQIYPVGEEDVYNLEVEDTQCFAVEKGVIVHNCYDADCMYFMSRPSPAQTTAPPKSLIAQTFERVKMAKESKNITQGW